MSSNLNEEQEAQVAIFMSVCNDADFDQATSVLAANEWDAERAIAAYIGHRETREEQRQKPAPKKPQPKKEQQYFVGGGESSGQAVVAPPTGGEDDRDGREVVSALFDRAREMGATDITNHRDADNTFSGDGRRLGFAPGPSPVVQSVKKRDVKVRITFYANGFVVGDETQLQDPRSPEGRAFLEVLDKGYIPREIAQAHPNCDISVELVDRSGQDYTPPAYVAYGGEGRTLKSDAPAASSTPSASAPAPPTSFSVDDSQPTAKVVLQMQDGTRQEVRVNPDTHTVNDLRGLVVSAQRLNADAFDLMHRSFPKPAAPLTDVTATISAAGLKNSVVMVKLR